MKRALLITICIVLWIGSVEAQSKRRNPRISKEDAEADAMLNQLLRKKEREAQENAVKLREMERYCGVRIFPYELDLGWRSLGKSKLDNYFYDMKTLLCTQEGMLKVWVKALPTLDGLLDTRRNQAVHYTLTRFEIKCRSNRFRMVSIIYYDKDGNVMTSQSWDDDAGGWEDAPPNSIGEMMINGVCHK